MVLELLKLLLQLLLLAHHKIKQPRIPESCSVELKCRILCTQYTQGTSIPRREIRERRPQIARLLLHLCHIQTEFQGLKFSILHVILNGLLKYLQHFGHQRRHNQLHESIEGLTHQRRIFYQQLRKKLSLCPVFAPSALRRIVFFIHFCEKNRPI